MAELVGEDARWDPHPDALRTDISGDGGMERSTSVLLQHGTTPFLLRVPTGDKVAIEDAATDYVREADRVAGLKLPPWWLNALPRGHPRFGWLPFRTPPNAGVPRSIGSPRVVGGDTTGKGRPSRTLILLASEWLSIPGVPAPVVLGSEFGLRVVSHLRSVGDGTGELRITGLSASLPFGIYDRRAVRARGNEFRQVFSTLGDFTVVVGRELNLDPTSISFRGFRIGDEAGVGTIEIRGRGLALRSAERSDPYEFLLMTRVGDAGRLDIVSASKVPLVACMAGTARVFRRDPASQGPPQQYRSRRPTRAEPVFDVFRRVEAVPTPLQSATLEVLQTRYVLGDQPGSVKSVPLPNGAPPVRSNDMCAVSAHRSLERFFERLALHGIDPREYFELASLPLQVFYRSGIRPGPGKDGQTVNGQVRPDCWCDGIAAFRRSADEPFPQVHLALADLSTRDRKAWNGTDRMPAEPLGFGADPRWIWHEIGHVLLMAAVGELEFRFAHSPGDALAAIVADPFSDLSDDPDWRGHTYPWVFVPRRHDRSVLHGWSWSGTLGRPLRDLPDADRLRRKGYWTEQILSSTLFRLYRSLGGDTVHAGTGKPDRPARKRASDHAVFLIVQALKALGDQRVVPANRAELFAAALSDADEGTETCATTLDENDAVPGAPRIGGCARKVVRWAFEAQGMFPADPAATHNGPGRPEGVDVFIRDRRAGRERTQKGLVPYGRGAYDPVSLDWGQVEDVENAAPPAWFAYDRSIRLRNGAIRVAVSNRGQDGAAGVTVDLWWRAWPTGQPKPGWNEAGWTHAGRKGPSDVPSGARKLFVFPFAAAPAGRHLVFAQATCAADRANTDGTGLACSRLQTPLDQLVPGDNNLGLAVIHVP